MIAKALAIALAATSLTAAAAEVDDASDADSAIDGSASGDIVVTAERRSTPLQRTPVSVGVIGGDELSKLNQTSVKDLASSVAGLLVPAGTSPSLSFVFIRGIGTISPTFNGAVGVYVDDIYQARVLNNGAFGLPDVERVEVLRGPQGTLYGQNTSGGAIRVISKTPGDTFTGSISAAVGNKGQFNGQAYVSGPLIPGLLSASIAYGHEEVGGLTWNETRQKKVGRIRNDQGRIKLHLTPGGGTDAVLSLYHLRDRSDNAAQSTLAGPNPRPRVTQENLDLRYNNDAYLASLVVTQDLADGLTAKSITGYRTFKNDPQTWSSDGSAADIFSWQLNLDQEQVSQEVQLLGDYGPLNFTLGGIYYHETFNVDRPSVTFGARGGAVSDTTTESVGIYGQGHYAITPRLGITLGLRAYWQKDKYSNSGYTSDANFQPVATTYTLTGLRQKTSGVTPKVGLDYQFADNVFGYASYTQGRKSGGYNPVASSAIIAAIPTLPEKVTTYEAGLKLGRGSAPVQFNISGFYNDFRNYQTGLSNVYVNGILVNGSVTFNAQKVRTYGVEAETILRPAERIELRANATALDATFTDFNYNTALGSGNYDGNRVPYTSKFTFGASAAYTLPVGDLGSVRLRGDVKYTSDAYTDLINNVPIPAQTYVNLDVQFTSADSHWSIFGRVRNLTDATYGVTGVPLAPTIPGVRATSYNPPRLFQVGAGYTF